MSENSSPAKDRELLELDALLGGEADAVRHTSAELQALEASTLANRFRTLLKQAMRDDDVSIRALAKRLGVSPSVISRRLASEGDLQVWTAAILAHALERAFSVEMHKVGAKDSCQSNYRLIHNQNEHWASSSTPSGSTVGEFASSQPTATLKRRPYTPKEQSDLLVTTP